MSVSFVGLMWSTTANQTQAASVMGWRSSGRLQLRFPIYGNSTWGRLGLEFVPSRLGELHSACRGCGRPAQMARGRLMAVAVARKAPPPPKSPPSRRRDNVRRKIRGACAAQLAGVAGAVDRLGMVAP